MFRYRNCDTVNILLPHNNLCDLSVVLMVLIDPVRNIGLAGISIFTQFRTCVNIIKSM